MPFLQIFTNLSRAQVPSNLGQSAAQLLSQTLTNKPIQSLVVHVLSDQNIFSGFTGSSTSPFAYAILRSIGSISLEENRKTIAAMHKLIKEKLSIPPNEFRMIFIDHDNDSIGVDDKIVTDILANK